MIRGCQIPIDKYEVNAQANCSFLCIILHNKKSLCQHQHRVTATNKENKKISKKTNRAHTTKCIFVGHQLNVPVAVIYILFFISFSHKPPSPPDKPILSPAPCKIGTSTTPLPSIPAVPLALLSPLRENKALSISIDIAIIDGWTWKGSLSNMRRSSSSEAVVAGEDTTMFHFAEIGQVAPMR
jgi:hypothetical protein